MSTKKLTALALLTTTAMILSYVESLLPSVGVPGVKLGLANIAVIFALYIGYDWVKAQQYVHTLDNAVDSALDIYMDIINLFLRVLMILGRNND